MRRTLAIFAVLAMGLPALSLAWMPEAEAITMPPLILPHNGKVVLNNFTGMQMANLSVNDTGAASLKDAGRVWGAGVQTAPLMNFTLDGAIAGGPDDRFVAAWSEYHGAATAYDIYANIFDVKGNIIKERIAVAAGPKSEGQPVVAVGPDGGFMVGWFDMRSGSPAVFGQRFDRDGNKAGAEMNISSEPGSKGFLDIAANSKGDYLLTWDEARPTNRHIYARMYSKTGASLTDEILVIGGSDSQQDPAVAFDADDRFAVAWTHFGSGTSTTVMAQRFDAQGGKMGMPIAPAVTNYPRSAPYVGYDPGGNLVLVWNDYHARGGYDYDIYAQRFDPAGNRRGSELTLVNDPWSQTTDGFAIDSRGQMLVAWSDNHTGSYQVYANLFEANGALLGKSVVAPSAMYRNMTCLDATVGPNEHFAVLWYEYTRSGNYTSYEQFARPYLQSRLLSGSLTTGVQAPPANLWRWDTLTADIRYGSASANSITFEYSVDGGANWTALPANNSLAAAGVSALTIRAKFSSLDNLTTPVLRSITLNYKYNAPPLVRLPADMTVKKNSNVTIESNITDVDMFDLVIMSYSWTQTAGKNLTLTNATGQNLSFKATSAGTFAFRLVVSDGYNDSAPATITVKVTETKPPAKSGYEWLPFVGVAVTFAVLLRRRR